MINKLFPGFKLTPLFPLKCLGTAISLTLLIIYRGLFFGPSLLADIEAEVPFENARPAVFVFLILITLFSFFHMMLCSYGRKSSGDRLWDRQPFSLIIAIAAAFANSVLSFFLIELVNNYYLANMRSPYPAINIGITFAIYLFFIFVFNSLSAGLFAGNVLFLVWSLVNYYVLQFRGIPFQWIDFGSMRTGLSVSGNYDYSPTWQIITAIIVTAAVCGICLHAGKWHLLPKIRGKIASRVIALIVFFAFSGVIFRTDFLADSGIWLREWQPWYTYRLFGMEAGFFAFAKNSYPTAPDGYSASKVKEIAAEAGKLPDAARESDVIPDNIIVIMNESFTDLNIYPNFKADKELTPNIDAIEDKRTGHLLVSVKGGFTANTEYEFLTGNSCVLAPQTVVFNSFIKQDQFSIVRVLKDQGYRAVAMHPYGQYGWNRNVVYPRMGFDEFLHINNAFEGAETLRGMVTDRSNYDELIKMIEEKEDGEKLFIFNITMQNHSSYKSPAVVNDVDIIGYKGENEGQAEKYCTLLRMSDEAIADFIDYFRGKDEKTLILFFGDHQPEIGDDFWYYCQGKSAEELSFDEQELEYMTPWFIWANYDLPAAEDTDISANYLGAYLLSMTGLDLSGYEEYLLHMREEIPVMNAYGYLGDDGKYHSFTADDPDEEVMSKVNDYKCLIYNELTGGNDRPASFFGLTE